MSHLTSEMSDDCGDILGSMKDLVSDDRGRKSKKILEVGAIVKRINKYDSQFARTEL